MKTCPMVQEGQTAKFRHKVYLEVAGESQASPENPPGQLLAETDLEVVRTDANTLLLVVRTDQAANVTSVSIQEN